MGILDMSELMNESEDLASLIAESDIAIEYKLSRMQMKQDREVDSLIKEFQYKKERYAEVERFGRYHPDYLKIRREVYEFKRNIEQHPVINRFKEAEKALEELLFEVSQMLATQISDTIMVPGTNPFFKGAGCGSGGCGSGGSCGCK